MAVTLLSSPSSPNATETKLLYNVSSVSSSQAQYNFILDVYRGASQVGRIRTIPNPNGTGVFDISAIVEPQLNFDATFITTASIQNNTVTSGEFTIKLGEEYASSPTSSVVVYPNQVTRSITLFKGTHNPLDNNSFNFDYETFGSASVEGTSSLAPFDSIRGFRLSDKPYGSIFSKYSTPISSSDYETITILPGEWELNKILLYVDYGEPVSSDNIQSITGNVNSNSNIIIPVGPAQLEITEDFLGYTVSIIMTKSGGGTAISTYVYSNSDICGSITGSFYAPANQLINSNVWSLIAPQPNPGGNNSAFGSRDGAVNVGGDDYNSHEFNGLTWGSAALTNNLHIRADATGIPDAGIIVGGLDGNYGTKKGEIYDGTSWSNIGDIGYNIALQTMVGTQNAAVVVGGAEALFIANETTRVTEWDGIGFATKPQLPHKKGRSGGGGTVNSYLVFGGSSGTSDYEGDVTYEWNGISFSTEDNLVFGTATHRGGGSVTDQIAFGGTNTTGPNAGAWDLVQFYDGISWSGGPTMRKSRQYFGGDSSNSSGKDAIAIGAGGGQGENTAEVLNGIIYNTQSFDLQGDNNINDNVTRLAFINKYGAWDYYTTSTLPTRTTNITRENTNLPKVNYSNTTSPYSYSSRSKTTVSTEITNNFNLTTEYLDQNKADWLRDLVDSPSVFVQYKDRFLPITLTNTFYDVKSNELSQKMFQYNIDFQFSKEQPPANYPSPYPTPNPFFGCGEANPTGFAVNRVGMITIPTLSEGTIIGTSPLEFPMIYAPVLRTLDMEIEIPTGYKYAGETINCFPTAFQQPILGYWVTVAPMNTSLTDLAGAGTRSSAIAFGGWTKPRGWSSTNEEWNDITWVTRSGILYRRFNLSGVGTSTSAFAIGGYGSYSPDTPFGDIISDYVEEWDDISWVLLNQINTPRQQHTSTGNTSNALVIGGGNSEPSPDQGGINTVEEWNGSTWSFVSNFATNGRRQLASSGTTNAALAIGGQAISGSDTSVVNEYNGTTWSTISSLPIGVYSLAGGGTVDNTLVFGGNDYSQITQKYNGITWEVATLLNVGRTGLGGVGNGDAALAMGGLISNDLSTAGSEIYYDGIPIEFYYSDADVSGFAVSSSGLVTPPTAVEGMIDYLTYSTGYLTGSYPLVDVNTTRSVEVGVEVPRQYLNSGSIVSGSEFAVQELVASLTYADLGVSGFAVDYLGEVTNPTIQTGSITDLVFSTGYDAGYYPTESLFTSSRSVEVSAQIPSGWFNQGSIVSGSEETIQPGRYFTYDDAIVSGFTVALDGFITNPTAETGSIIGFTYSDVVTGGYFEEVNNDRLRWVSSSIVVPSIFTNSGSIIGGREFFDQPGYYLPYFFYSTANVSGFAVSSSGEVTAPTAETGSIYSLTYSAGYDSGSNSYPQVTASISRSVDVEVTIPVGYWEEGTQVSGTEYTVQLPTTAEPCSTTCKKYTVRVLSEGATVTYKDCFTSEIITVGGALNEFIAFCNCEDFTIIQSGSIPVMVTGSCG